MPAYPLNQYSPLSLAGVQTPPPAVVGYEDRPYDYVYEPPNGQLSANQFLNPDTLSIYPDADFLAFGYYISFASGLFQVQFIDSTGYELSSGMMRSTAISTVASDPTVFSPAHPFPAGGQIKVIIQDLSGATNTIQLVFKGVKRFRQRQ